MNVEGRGIVPPAPVWVPLTPTDFIEAKDRAVRQAMERDYCSRRDSWGRGYVGSGRPRNCADLRPYEYPILLGIIGEIGTAAHINQRMGKEVTTVDLDRKSRGDGGIDITPCGLTIQVKTQQDPRLPGLIRRVDHFGRLVPLTARSYVFARFDRERQSGVWLLGWVWTKDIVDFPTTPAIRGNHENIKVPSSLYRSIPALIHEIKQRKIARQERAIPWH